MARRPYRKRIFTDAQEIQVRQLRVLEKKSFKEIADALGKPFTANQIRNLCVRKKWSMQKRHVEEEPPAGTELANAELIEAVRPTAERVERILAQSEADGEELRRKGMEMARAAMNPRDLNSAAQVVAKSTKMLRDALGIADAGAGGSRTVNLHFHGDPENPFHLQR